MLRAGRGWCSVGVARHVCPAAEKTMATEGALTFINHSALPFLISLTVTDFLKTRLPAEPVSRSNNKVTWASLCLALNTRLGHGEAWSEHEHGSPL